MTIPQIDHVSAGHIFAYDAKTGAVLWCHEKIVEVVRGQETYPPRITDAECEEVRAEAAKVFRDREIKALIAPEGFRVAENVRIRIDPKTRTLQAVPETRSLADRLADLRK